jgi:hypothetical protein
MENYLYKLALTNANAELIDSSATNTTTSPTRGTVEQETSSILKFNKHPKDLPDVMKSIVTLKTLDVSDQNRQKLISEEYKITPSFTGLIKCRCPEEIYVLPLGDSIYGIKFYYPKPTSVDDWNKFYVTFCKKNASYYTGYADFYSSVSTAFMTAFFKWADVLPKNTEETSVSVAPTVSKSRTFTSDEYKNKKYKSLIFYYTGSATNQRGNSNCFTLKFEYYPSTTPSALKPASTTLTTATRA